MQTHVLARTSNTRHHMRKLDSVQSRAAPKDLQRTVYCTSSTSRWFDQFRSVSSTFLRSLPEGVLRPRDPPKSASGARAGRAFRGG
eukprot:13179819-Alexandrium_andersonii.AAC.1